MLVRFMLLYLNFVVRHIFFSAQHRINSRYKHKTLEEARRVALPNRPTFWFTLISAIFLFAPLDQRMHIHTAKINSMYVETLVQEWSTFNLAVRYISLVSEEAVLILPSGYRTVIVCIPFLLHYLTFPILS
jgi:hypothetical protein